MKIDKNIHYDIVNLFKEEKKVGFIDEVGRGSIAGDFYSCCVVMNKDWYDKDINDSKQIKKEVMCQLADKIKENVFNCTLGIVTVEEINTLKNLDVVTALSFQRSIHFNHDKKPDIIYIDGQKNKYFSSALSNSLGKDIISKQVNWVVHGDSKVFGIACASVMAKCARDIYMKALHLKLPYYGWNTNAGYRCKKHWEGIHKHGASEYHRMYLIEKFINDNYYRTIKNTTKDIL